MTVDANSQLDDRELSSLLRLRLGPRRSDDEVCGELALVAAVLSGDAGPDEIIRAGEHIRDCASCADTVRAWRDLPAEPRAASERPKRTWLALQPVAWATAAVLIVASTLVWQLSEQPGDRFAVKGGGGDAFFVAVQRGQRRFRLQPGQSLQDGDSLGFFYSATESGYLTLLSTGQDGEATVLFPRDAANSAPIAAGSERPLPDGGIFRRGEGCEWLVAVFSDRPLALAPLVASLRAAAVEAGDDCALAFAAAHARAVSVVR